MNIFQAYIGGLGNIFSVWVFCLLQIIPFFLAFIAGFSMVGQYEEDSRKVKFRLAFISAVPLLAYMAVFTAMGVSSSSISGLIFKYLELLNQFGGVFIGLSGLYLLGLLTLKEPGEQALKIIIIALGIAFGAAMSFAYKPCVTPTLTYILNMNASPATAGKGAVLLAFYTLGVITVIFAAGYLLSLYLTRLSSIKLKTNIKKFCGAILMAAALLILTGKMTDYKSFLVGGFVPHQGNHGEAPKDSGGMEQMNHAEHSGH